MSHAQGLAAALEFACDASSAEGGEDVEALEAEVARRERQLSTRAERLSEAARALRAQLAQLRASSAEAQLGGAGDARLAEVQARLQRTFVPDPDIRSERDAAVAARMAAVLARTRAVQRTEELMSTASSAQEALFEQLAAESRALSRLIVELAERSAAEALAREAEAGAEGHGGGSVEAPREAEAGARGHDARGSAAPREAGARVHPNRAGAVSDPAEAVDERLGSGRTQARAVAALDVDRAIAARGPTLRAAGPEQRRCRRVALTTSVDLASDSNVFTGFSTDVSTGGLFVATLEMLPIGASVEVSFSIPEAGTFTAEGTVKWAREMNDQTPEIFPGLGVQFGALPADARAALERLTAVREPLFFPD